MRLKSIAHKWCVLNSTSFLHTHTHTHTTTHIPSQNLHTHTNTHARTHTPTCFHITSHPVQNTQNKKFRIWTPFYLFQQIQNNTANDKKEKKSTNERPSPPLQNLFERDEARGMGGPDSRAAVLHWFVGDGELTQVMADHLRLHTSDYSVNQHHHQNNHHNN